MINTNLKLKLFHIAEKLVFGFADILHIIFHMVINVFKFDCEITIESAPGTNQYSNIEGNFSC